jgi:CheY-like chemotaxis protein
MNSTKEVRVTLQLTSVEEKWVRQQAVEGGIFEREVVESALRQAMAAALVVDDEEEERSVVKGYTAQEVAESVERVVEAATGHDVHAVHMDPAKAMQISLARREGQRAFDRSQRPLVERAAAAARSKEVIRKLEEQERDAGV